MAFSWKMLTFARMNSCKWLVCCIVVATLLPLGCNNDDDIRKDDVVNDIRLKVSGWQVLPGTRAATFDNAAALQSEGTFTCAVYNAETTTSYVSSTAVNWDGSENEWLFSDGKHYWPIAGSLDFFAYMPATPPSYITDMSDAASSVTYVAGDPQFKCVNLPMTPAGQGSSLQEFVYALATGQNKAAQGASGVTLTFQHPFARINLQLSASHPDVMINKITFKGIKNNGTYLHSGTPSKWTTTGDATNLVLEFEGSAAEFYDNASAPTPIGPAFIMIPQEWKGDIDVEATWDDWGVSLKHTLSTTVPTVTWEPGRSYTYSFTITQIDLRVDTDKYTEQW